MEHNNKDGTSEKKNKAVRHTEDAASGTARLEKSLISDDEWPARGGNRLAWDVYFGQR